MAEAAKKKGLDISLLSRVFQFVKPYKSHFLLSICLAIVLAIFAPIRPYLIQLTIDAATGKALHIPGWLHFMLIKTDFNDATRFIISVTIFQVIFLFVETALRFIFSFVTAVLGQSVVKDLRVTVYKK